MGHDIVLDGSVLAPRLETELLGRHALSLLNQQTPHGALVIDMCCGSGNIACALAASLPSIEVLAADLTEDAIRTAGLNVSRLGLSDRVRVCRGDLFGALQGQGAEHKALMIVCNPPYISTGKLSGESAHLLDEEPREAFDGGPYGIAVQQRLVREAPGFLTPGGYLLFEFGLGQERQAASLLNRAGCYRDIGFVEDENGHPRVAVARLQERVP